MATDFFARQDHARRQTIRLMVLFGLAVVAIILAIYLLAAIAIGEAHHEGFAASRPAGWWHPQVLLWVSVGTLLVIGLGSLYKISELSAGGRAIAAMLGGRLVSPQTTNLAERRLLNVVEEMSLASGVPVPPVYVLDREPGINAFAAGHELGDAVVAVSAGCLQYLRREELQGVIGHEFSHILNGDMRLNLRLIGIVYGILVLAIIGYYTMRMAGSISSGKSKKDNSGAGAIFLFGLALLIVGYLGVFFGNLIKAAINRQREFLADASAVQFTRYPGGIAGALKKIGGLAEGSRVRDAHAAEISHMFFGDAFAGSFFNLFATHPPLASRISALEPEFDGRFPTVVPLSDAAETAAAEPAERQAVHPSAAVLGAAALSLASDGNAEGPAPQAAEAGQRFVEAGKMVERIGRPQADDVKQAERLLAGLPPVLRDATREPFTAQALIFALLLSRDDAATLARQLQILSVQVVPGLPQQTQKLAGIAGRLDATVRIALVELTLPALTQSSPQQYAQFRQAVELLVRADGKMDLFEYSLRMMLFSYLDVHFGLKKPAAAGHRTIRAVAQPAAVVLSTLAHVGHKSAEDAQRAFQAAAGSLLGQREVLPPDQCTLAAVDTALNELAQVSPKVKRSLIAAAIACIATDGCMTARESELLRAMAGVLRCPLPPLALTIPADTTPSAA